MDSGPGALPECDPAAPPASYEEFRSCAYQEPDTGTWIVDGDVAITDEAELRAFYDVLMDTPSDERDDALSFGTHESTGATLIVDSYDGADSIWPPARQCDIRYCVSRAALGDLYQPVVDAIHVAADDWSRGSGVRFHHVVSQDGKCNASNALVDFDVGRGPNGATYAARAFSPRSTRRDRNLLINVSAFTTELRIHDLPRYMRHELGHVLGFRHEHVRVAASKCMREDTHWRPVTPYDSASVMHYPSCGGTSDYTLTAYDRTGVTALYGDGHRCNPAQVGASTACGVYDDGNDAVLAEAFFYGGPRAICAPDGTERGACGQWLGMCGTSEGRPMAFSVSEDETGPGHVTSSIYFPSVTRGACYLDLGVEHCGHWFGPEVTGEFVRCYLFDDGRANMIGPVTRMRLGHTLEFCMADGSTDGTCRRWFGDCRVH